MPPRPVWTGSIAFGLVRIPIKLYSAIESHRVAFHEVEKETGRRIRYKRVAEGSNKEVPWGDIERAFQVSKDRAVVLTSDEIASAAPEKTKAVELEQFVPLTDIDPVLWDQSYYAAPDGASAAKAYVLLRDVMRKQGRVAIGRFVMRTKEYVACIRPLDHALALHTMFFSDEVRDARAVVDLPPRTVANARELNMAGQLVAALAGKWDPEGRQDEFKARVLAVVKKKGQGQAIEVAPAAAAPARTVDLMEALRATLERGKPASATRARALPASGRAPAERARPVRSRSHRSTGAARDRLTHPAKTRRKGGSK